MRQNQTVIGFFCFLLEIKQLLVGCEEKALKGLWLQTTRLDLNQVFKGTRTTIAFYLDHQYVKLLSNWVVNYCKNRYKVYLLGISSDQFSCIETS
ncbi:hypothetical protein OIU77_029407 [Salix suchowensis]|uniref:Uncharacterized protein n=1 Tax=Salix suchowensis TaxID=1278906 RepID=A0ABQ9BA91_9ROSI|nr:hypothetical protein OIU77_029407 [Salix suchowensis]